MLIQSDGLITWQRSVPAAEDASGSAPRISCLWSAGCLANRRDLARHLSLSEDRADGVLITALYHRYGSSLAGRLAGSLAWILWDGRRRRLVAARDRLGTQGLYFQEQGDRFRLATSVEALLSSASGRNRRNEAALVAHLHGQAPPPGETFYRGIQAVRPGGLLIATPDRIAKRSYWSLRPGPTLRLTADGEYAEALRELLFQVAQQYLPRSPSAVTLSGGLDSTSVAAAMAQSPSAQITALRWLAPGLPEADEGRFSAAVVRMLGCPEITLQADRHWPLRRDDSIRPTAASPLFNFYSDVWEATFDLLRQRGIRCLFSGCSGDDLFGGGVFSYPDLLLTGRWLRLARGVRDHVRYPNISLVPVIRQGILGPIAQTYLPLRRWAVRPPVPWLGKRYREWHRDLSPPVSRRLLPGRWQRLRHLREPFLPFVAEFVTRQAAHHGVEFRHPLLDSRLVEFAARLPSSQTFRGGRRKIIVRNAMRGYLPDEILDQPGKLYPTAIVDRGLRDREQAKVQRWLTQMRAAELGLVDEARLREAYSAYVQGKSRSCMFWHAMTLEAWLRKYFDS